MNAGKSPVGVILAGGLSSRMRGPEKTLLPLAEKPMIARIHERLAKQVGQIVINANGDPARFDFLPSPIMADTLKDNPGPLAGVLAGMSWCISNSPRTSHILTVAGDTPFFPADLAERLTNAVSDIADPAIALAYSDGNRHPTFGIWPVSLCESLNRFLDGGDRKVMLFAKDHNLQKVEFPMIGETSESIDPFFNVNTPEDFAKAETLIAELERQSS